MIPVFDADVWSVAGLHVETPVRGAGLAHDDFLLVRFDVRHSHGGAVPTRELCRSLSSWLKYQADGMRDVGPVRVAIEAQRAELRRRSAEMRDLEEFRSGLAWAESALAAVADVAAGKERA